MAGLVGPDGRGANDLPSRAGNAPPLQDFFGTLSADRRKMLAEDGFARETYNLPKAYEGRNLFLENVLDYLITNESDWYTSAALPWVKTDQLSVQWEIFRFNKTLFDLEPEQGPPRYVSAEREARSDRLVRRGLGFIIEHGFYETEEGRSHYLMNLRQISDSVHETAYFGVMSALLSSHDYYKAYRAEHGPISNNFGLLTRRERNRWAVIQKDEHGLHMLDAEVKHEFRRHGREHNMIVLPDSTSMYVTMVPDYQKEYSRHGPGVAANLEKGEDNMLTFRGKRVVESKPFDIDFIGEGIDLLLRERMIGERFIIPPQDADAQGAQQACQGIRIYSADTDRFETITRASLNDALKFDINGDPIAAGGPDITDTNNTVVVLRPFQRYLTGSALFLNGGAQLGATYHGHHNFMLSDDVIRKVHVGHYTFYHKSIIKDDKNLTIAEDIVVKDYLGGEGAKPFTERDLEAAQLGNWDQVTGDLICIVLTPNAIAHLNGQDPAALAAGAIAAPTDLETLLSIIPNPISINGGFDGEPYAARYEPGPNAYDGPNIGVMASLFPRNGGGAGRAGNQTRFLSDIRSNNSICYQGMQLDLLNRVRVLNSGHWGPNGSGPGCKAVRHGEMAFLKEKNYADNLFTQIVANNLPPAGPGAGAGVGGNPRPAGAGGQRPQAVPQGSDLGSTAAIPSSASARRRAKKKEPGVGGPSV